MSTCASPPQYQRQLLCLLQLVQLLHHLRYKLLHHGRKIEIEIFQELAQLIPHHLGLHARLKIEMILASERRFLYQLHLPLATTVEAEARAKNTKSATRVSGKLRPKIDTRNPPVRVLEEKMFRTGTAIHR
jgi:hypothetical protein